MDLASIDGITGLEGASSASGTVNVPDGWAGADLNQVDQVLLARSFKKPTGIEKQTLAIQVDGDPQPTKLFLNGQLVTLENGKADVTNLLSDTNWLILEFTDLKISEDPENSSFSLFDEVLLLIVEQ